MMFDATRVLIFLLQLRIPEITAKSKPRQGKRRNVKCSAIFAEAVESSRTGIQVKLDRLA